MHKAVFLALCTISLRFFSKHRHKTHEQEGRFHAEHAHAAEEEERNEDRTIARALGLVFRVVDLRFGSLPEWISGALHFPCIGVENADATAFLAIPE